MMTISQLKCDVKNMKNKIVIEETVIKECPYVSDCDSCKIMKRILYLLKEDLTKLETKLNCMETINNMNCSKINFNSNTIE